MTLAHVDAGWPYGRHPIKGRARACEAGPVALARARATLNCDGGLPKRMLPITAPQFPQRDATDQCTA